MSNDAMTKEIPMTDDQRRVVSLMLIALFVAATLGADVADVDPASFPKENGKLVIFNGKDLTGWDGDPKIWSVKDGAIVGKHNGLNHNDFLKSKFAAGDFRLTLKAK